MSRLRGGVSGRTKREKWSRKSGEGRLILRDECAMSECRRGVSVVLQLKWCEKRDFVCSFLRQKPLGVGRDLQIV